LNPFVQISQHVAFERVKFADEPMFGSRRRCVTCVLVASSIALTACDRSLTHDVHDNAALRGRVIAVVPPGTDTLQARRTMTREGFECTFHRGVDVDTLAEDVDTPPDRLTCLKAVNAQPETADGYRQYVVDLMLDGARIQSIETRMWMDRKL
jgi:hypothetical protein